LQKSGFSRANIRDDLVNAKVLANRDKLIKRNTELSEALKSRSTLSTGASYSSSIRDTDGPAPKVTEAERKMLEAFGAMERFKKQN
jgi:hypothetical protein